jgi:F-type H+-transporting ATPase subunit a
VSSPVEQFEIKQIIPLHIAGLDLSFTNSSLWMLIGVLLSTIFLTVATSRRSLIPSRGQAFAEMIYEFVANTIRENLGSHGRQYFPLVFSVFMIVLMGNMLGMIPFSFTYTSHIIVTLALALMVFLTVLIIGLARHGLHFFSLFLPPGVPLWLAPMIIPIEIISFLIRPITLSVRLFANMLAGHILLKVMAGFSVSMLLGLGTAGFFAGLLPAAFNVLLITFEFLIAFIQAYVFTVLTCIYLKDTLELEH